MSGREQRMKLQRPVLCACAVGSVLIGFASFAMIREFFVQQKITSLSNHPNDLRDEIVRSPSGVTREAIRRYLRSEDGGRKYLLGCFRELSNSVSALNEPKISRVLVIVLESQALVYEEHADGYEVKAHDLDDELALLLQHSAPMLADLGATQVLSLIHI